MNVISHYQKKYETDQYNALVYKHLHRCTDASIFFCYVLFQFENLLKYYPYKYIITSIVLFNVSKINTIYKY